MAELANQSAKKLANPLANKIAKLPGAEAQGEWDPEAAAGADTPAKEADAATAGLAARVRLMMLISGLTTFVAIAAVIGVIGYRIYHAGNSGTGPVAEGIVTLPKTARVIATAVAGDRIVVTLDIGGATEIRTFDAKTLKEAGRIRFATEP
jgi:hypothetical protein